MKPRLSATGFMIWCAMFLSNWAIASTSTIGPKGINSAGWKTANGMPLNGDGIAIGQVELARPGKEVADGGFDDTIHSSSDVVPTDVFRRTTSGAGLANLFTNDHAEEVASIMIGTDLTDPDGAGPRSAPTGVSTGASLYSSATDPGSPPAPFDDEAAVSINHLATLPGVDIRAINMSFGNPFDPNHSLNDGNQKLTQFVDWSAAEHDILYVASGYEGNLNPIPKDNFNGITVAYSELDSGVWSRVSSGNDYSFDAEGPRTSIDILAPGDNVDVTALNSVVTNSGTSFAAPHVTGTVALLQQYGDERITAGAPSWGGTVISGPTARRHEVMKAVLLNSADKLKDDGTFAPVGSLLGMERTVLDINGDNWLASEANDDSVLTGSGDIPLDDQMGAGHLNAKRALQQFLPGEFDSDGADVPSIGWDYGMTSGQGDTNGYRFSQTLQAGSYISITLAWDREVNFDTDGGTIGAFDSGDTFEEYTVTDPFADDVISDLDLILHGPVFIEAQSVSLEGTLEHIFFEIPVTGTYRFEVEQFDADAGPQSYGVAWWYDVAPVLIVSGDFDGDGDVDSADLAQWEGDYGLNADSDADGDGDSDGADFLVWQRNFGTGVPLTAVSQAVPESATWLLLAMGVLVVPRRNRSSSPN